MFSYCEEKSSGLTQFPLTTAFQKESRIHVAVRHTEFHINTISSKQ